MAKIDRLREEAIELRTRMFFILGLIAIFFGGFGSLYIKLVEKSSGMIIAGMFVLLILIPFLAIIYYKIRVSYFEKLNELELEEG